jgi:CBS domain-containing protein
MLVEEPLFGRPDELVGHLADRMAENGIGRVPVIDASGRLVGLVARKDLLAARARRVAEERDRARLLVRQPNVRKAARAASPR